MRLSGRIWVTSAGCAALVMGFGIAVAVRHQLQSPRVPGIVSASQAKSPHAAPRRSPEPVAAPVSATALGGVPPEERPPGAGIDLEFYDRRRLMVSKTVSFDGGVAIFVRPKGASAASTHGAIPLVELRFHDASAGATLEALLVGEESPSGQKRFRCFQQLGARLGHGPLPGRWNIHLRASAKGGKGQLQYFGPVDGKWPSDFDEEAQRCVQEAYQGITFSADHEFEYDLDHEQCIGGHRPDAEGK